MLKKIKYIAFDADDTLWVNEPYFQDTERKFCQYMSDFLPEHEISKELFKTEIQNLELYGYGVKAFILSMIETALRISDNKINPEAINQIISLGKEMLNKPIELLDGIKEVLEALSSNYKLIVATKGDLLDQERKLNKSGLAKYFHHVEIMSDKQIENYQSLLNHLEIKPEEFLMVGNSLKSDIFPVLSMGSYAVHIPYHTTWQYEQVNDSKIESDKYYHFEKVIEMLSLFDANSK